MIDPIFLVVIALMAPGFLLLVAIVVSFVIRKRDNELGPIVDPMASHVKTTVQNDAAK